MSEEDVKKKYTVYLLENDSDAPKYRIQGVDEKYLKHLDVYFDRLLPEEEIRKQELQYWRYFVKVENEQTLNHIKSASSPVFLQSLLAFLSLGSNRIKKAPGYRILAVAEFLCGPKTIDQVFEPLVSDWQEEHFAALSQGRWFKARWISIRYMWKALLAFGLSKLLTAVRAFSTKR